LKLSSPSQNDGFTYIEVITAIIILSLSGFIVWSGISLAGKALESTINSIRTNNEISVLEYDFRQAVNSIQVQYWKGERDSAELNCFHDKILVYNTLVFHSLHFYGTGAELKVLTKAGREIVIFEKWGSYYLEDKL